jgi:hypothetical protein
LGFGVECESKSNVLLVQSLYINFKDILKVKGEQVKLKLATGAKRGLDATPETIREGSVRMEQHPEYANTLTKIKELGFDIENTYSDPYVEVKEVLNSQKEVVRVLKVVYVQEGMRYLDLEHELGHIRQLTERFGDKCLPTERVIEYPDGRVKDISDKGGVLTNWQNTVTEYHNRLDEFLHLYERGANIELLSEHGQGIRKWKELYKDIGLKRGKSPSRKSWVEKHFPDLYGLEERYSYVVVIIEQ